MSADEAQTPRTVIRFYKQAELRAIERGYKEAARVIHDDIDTTFASVTTDCKKGCSHCCYLKVEVLPPEAAIIVDYVRNTFPPAVRQRMLDRLKENAVAEVFSTPKEYRQKALPCAFLGDDGTCAIYDVRPITCRGFGSTNVKVCSLEQEDDKQTTFSAAPQSLLMLVATSGLFWTGMAGACLSYWMGLPIEVAVSEDDMKKVHALRQELDASLARRKALQRVVPG